MKNDIKYELSAEDDLYIVDVPELAVSKQMDAATLRH